MATKTEEPETSTFEEAVETRTASHLADALSERFEASKASEDRLTREWNIDDSLEKEQKMRAACEKVSKTIKKVLGNQWINRHFDVAMKMGLDHLAGSDPLNAYRHALSLREDVYSSKYDTVVELPARDVYQHTQAETTARLEGDPQPTPVPPRDGEA